ncbi:MAG: helix-turn-helix domain-containing protein [Cellulomonadaceae bacterium]|nr:helix-turn-helix domain-containing protein [Cellulomonadaceae bacterium]
MGTPLTGTSVGVIDKAWLILTEIAKGPLSVQNVALQTGMARPTAHRIIKSLEYHRIVVRDLLGRYVIGPAPFALVSNYMRDPLGEAVETILQALQQAAATEALLFWADGIERICIAATAPEVYGVQIGTRLPPSHASSALTIFAWSTARRLAARNHISTTPAEFNKIRHSGWAQGNTYADSISTSAPVRDPKGEVVAAVTLAARYDKRTDNHWLNQAQQVKAAAKELSNILAEFA